MNKYVRKLGFRASDELEMRATIKAIRFAWIYVMLFLAGWSVFEAVTSGEIPMIHIALILTAELAYLAMSWWYIKKEINESQQKHNGVKHLTAKGKGKNSYEFIYEDEDGNQYVYEEVNE